MDSRTFHESNALELRVCVVCVVRGVCGVSLVCERRGQRLALAFAVASEMGCDAQMDSLVGCLHSLFLKMVRGED